MEINILEDVEDGEHIACKGLFFRYRRSEYMSSRGSIEIRESYVPLKRRSCSGCQYCGGFENDISAGGIENMILYPSRDPEDGEVYTLTLEMGSRDWETGYIDEWWWKLVKVDE